MILLRRGIMMQVVSNLVKTQDFFSADNNKSIKHEERKNIIFLIVAKASVAFINEQCTLRQALEKMKYHAYSALPVIAEDGTYVGTVSEGDFLWHMLNDSDTSMKAQEDSLITDIVRKDWNPAVKIDTTMEELLQRLMDQNFVPVIDDREKFVGIITRRDFIKYYCGLVNTR